MKKFSKLNESKDVEMLGWSPNDILKELSTISNCKVSYKISQFIFREDGHEICTLEEIKNGEIKSTYHQQTLQPDTEYHPQHTFVLNYGNFFTSQKYLLFGGGEEFETAECVPLYKIVDVFAEIQNSVRNLRDDFYIHIYQENSLNLHHLEIELDFTQKDSVEADYIINKFK